jgi:proline iminopeptidase
MQRRRFLKKALALSAGATASASYSRLTHAAATGQAQSANPLNPNGIRVAGIRMLPVCSGKYKVWTKQVGSGPVKVLLLHGGPGFPHDYLEAMESFLPQAGIEMYYYDQLGVGNSDIPDDPSLWTLDRYMTEVEEVRTGLGLDHFVLYGHSWGAILAMEYALHHQEHLRGLVISNMTAGMQSYLKRTQALKEQLLTPEQRRQLDALAAANDYDKDWDRWDRLHEIRVKALTIGSNYDEMDPADMVKMAKLMKNATSAICANGSHLDMWDDQAAYFRHLLAFLRSV